MQEWKGADQCSTAVAVGPNSNYAVVNERSRVMLAVERILSIIRGNIASPVWHIAHLVNANTHRQGPSDVLG